MGQVSTFYNLRLLPFIMKRYLAVYVLFLLPSTSLTAQLCTGSLGDPIVNITFGMGNGSGPELPAGQTTYNYSRTGCPKQNDYSLTNFTFGCFSDTWHRLIGDHTPADQDGYIMLINSAYIKGDLFVYTVKGLCPNTSYEFAGWAKNVIKPIACDKNAVNPNLTFKVETLAGVVITSYSSGELAKEENDPAWKQYGTLFKPPAGVTDVVLKITNNGVDGCGNVLALDDITLRACGPEVRATVASNGLSDVQVCAGSDVSYLLTSTYSTAYVNPTFQWQTGDGLTWTNIPGANTKTYLRKPTASGNYLYRVLITEGTNPFTPECRIGSNEISIGVLQAPFVQATGYIYGCLDGEVILLASGASSFLWTGPNGFTSTEQRPVIPKVQYSDSGMYKVTGTTDLGCVNSDSTVLRVFPKATAFSSGGTSICEGTSVALVAGGGARYFWEPREGLSNDTIATPIASPPENTVYHVRVVNQFGCEDKATIQVNVWKNPVANAGPDVKTRLGLPAVLKGTVKGSDVTWYWSPSLGATTTQSLDHRVNPPKTTTYTLHVVSPHGCSSHTDDATVKVYEKVLIPNAFSPNGDGINDTWYIEPLEFFTESSTEVYNRFGQLVYRSKGYSAPWNGTAHGNPLPVGTYYYIIDMGVQNQPKLTGSVTILR